MPTIAWKDFVDRNYVPPEVPEAEKNLSRQNTALTRKAVRIFGLQSEQIASTIPPESLRYGTKSLTGQLRYTQELMDRVDKKGNPYNPDYDIDPRATADYKMAKLSADTFNRPLSAAEEEELVTKIQGKYDTSKPENLLDEEVFKWALYREPSEQGQRSVINARNNFFVQSWSDAQKEQYLAGEAAKSIKEAGDAAFLGFRSRFAKSLAKGTANIVGGFSRIAEEAFGIEGGKAYADKLRGYATSAGLTTSEADGVLSFTADVMGFAAPYILAAGAGGGFGVIPGMLTAAATGFAAEGEDAYQETYSNAIAAGKSVQEAEEEANDVRINVGFINAAIEGFQFGTLFRFAKAGRGSRQALIRGILNKARKRGLKNFTGETAKMLFQEGAQEFAQEAVTVGVPGFMNDRWPVNKDGSIDFNAITERLGESFLGGVTMAAVLGSGGRMMNRVLYGKAPDAVGMNMAPVNDWKYAIRTPEEQSSDKPYLDNIGLVPSKFITASISKAQRIGERFGKKVVIFDDPLQENEEGFMFEGEPDVIYLSNNATESSERTIGHEFAHIIKISDPDAYTTIAAIAKKNTKRVDKLRKYFIELLKTKPAYAVQAETMVDDELVAEFVGSLFETTKIAEQIGKASPNFLVKINDYVQDTIDRMVGLQNMMDIDEYRINWRGSMYKVAEVLGKLQKPVPVKPVQELGRKAASIRKPSIRKPKKPEGVPEEISGKLANFIRYFGTPYEELPPGLKKQADIVVKRKFGEKGQPYQQTFGQYFNRSNIADVEYGTTTSKGQALNEWASELQDAIERGIALRPSVQDSLATHKPGLWIDIFRKRPDLLEGYIPAEIIRLDVIPEQQLLGYKRRAKEYRGQKRPSIRKEIAAQQVKAVTTEKYLNDFADHLRSAGFTASTQETYYRYARQFVDYLNSLGIKSTDKITEEHMRNFVLLFSKHKETTQELVLNIIRDFNRYAIETGAMSNYLAANIDFPKKAQLVPTYYPYEQITKLLEAPNLKTDRFAIRDRAILEMLYATGARASELATMEMGNVNMADQSIKVHGKGGKERIVFFGKTGGGALVEYLNEQRPVLAGTENPSAVFLSVSGKPLGRIEIWRIVKKYAQRVGLKNVHTHTLRHSFATHMMQRGVDISVISELLGHETIDSTTRYLATTQEQLAAVYKKYFRPPTQEIKKPESFAIFDELTKKWVIQKRPSIRKTAAVAKLKAKFKSVSGTDRLSGDKYLVTPDGYIVRVLREHNVTGHDAGTTIGEMMGEQILYASRYKGELAILSNGSLSSEQKMWMEEYVAFNNVNYIDLSFWIREKKNYERIPVDFSTSATIRKGINAVQGYLEGTIAPTARELPKGFTPSIRKRKAKETIKARIRAAITGRIAHPEKTIEESVALKMKLKAAQKASIEGYKAGKEAVRLILDEYKKGVKKGKDIRKFLRQTTQKSLPLKERGRMLRLVETTHTDKALVDALEKLQTYYDKHLKNIQKARLRKILKLLGKYKRSGLGGGAGYRMLPDIEESVSAIVDSFRMTTPSPKAVKAMAGIYEMAQTEVEGAKERGMVDPFTQFEVFDFIKKLETTMSKVPVNTMSAEDLENLADSLLILIHQHETEMAVMSDEKIKSRDEMSAAITEEIRAGWRREKPPEELSTKDKKAKWSWWGGLFGRHSMNLATLSRIAAGMKKDSLTEEVFSENLVRGVEVSLEHFYTIQDLVLDLMKENGITENDVRSWSKYTKRSPVFLGFANWVEGKTGATLDVVKKLDPETKYLTIKLEEGRELTVTIGEALDIYMHTKNAYNYKLLTAKNGVDISGIKVPQLTHEDVNNIIAELDKITEGKATLFANILTEAIKVQSDAINEVSLRLYGYELANRLGYWHIRRKLPPQAKGPQQDFAYETVESRSHFKEITGGSHPLYLGDALNNFVDTLNVGKDFIGLAEPMRTARMFIGDKAIQDMMAKKGYESYVHEIIAKLNDIESTYTKQGVLARMVGKLQRNLTRAIFSYSPRLAVQQYFSVTLAQDEFDWKYLKEMRFLMDKETRAEIYSHSFYFRQRFEGNISREMGDVAHSGSVLQFFTKKELYVNRPTAMVRNYDMRAVFDIWRMTKAVIYDEQVAPGKVELGSIRYWDEVTKLAERTVRKTQPTWHTVDRSMLGSTRDPLAKSLTMFHSQREKMLQMVHEANSRYANSKRTPADFLRLSRTYGIILLNLALVDIWNEVYKWVVLGAEEDPAAIAENFIGDIPGLLYFVGPVSRDALIGAIRTFRGKQTYARGELSFPPNRVAKLTAESSVAWAKWFSYAVSGTGDADTAIARAMGTTLELSNYLFGLPFLEVTKTLKANYKRFSK